MKKVNADSIIEYLFGSIVLFYLEYDIGKDIIWRYNINKIVNISFLITIVIYVIFTFYIIKKIEFSEFNIKLVKNLKEYFKRLILIILIAAPIAVNLIYYIDNFLESKILIILSVFLIVCIFALRLYYISTINKNKFHYLSIFLIIYITYLILISFFYLVVYVNFY